jgi:hypothetical protein
MTDISKEAVAKMMEGVTEGPWVFAIVSDDEDYGETYEVRGQPDGDGWADVVSSSDDPDDARFIAWAREAVPALSAERDALAAKLAEREAQVERLLAAQLDHEISLEAAEANVTRLEAHIEGTAKDTHKLLMAAEARVAELESIIRGKTFTVDEVAELTAENERLRKGLDDAFLAIVDARSHADPGSLFRVLNELLGKVDDIRRATIQGASHG